MRSSAHPPGARESEEHFPSEFRRNQGRMEATSSSSGTLRVRCCIAGGGPAGMMLGYLLARAGIEVLVLEKHADFLRDFRGDTVHPSPLHATPKLGFLDAFSNRPLHQL